MENRIGFSELYKPPDGTKVTVHIIFIHGLFGHPLNTWTSKRRDCDGRKICWPKDLLKTKIPDARVFSFGYDADVDGFLSSAGQNTIHQHAQSLLSDLTDLPNSPTEQATPLIFVVHSLGGIVVKDALNKSASAVDPRLQSVATKTYGICYLGTPHHGSQSASMGKIAYKCTFFLSKRPNLKLLRGLEHQSETLSRVGDEFSQTLRKNDIAIHSFREEKATRKLLVFSTTIVNADSAKIGDRKETTSSIPANHSDMAKCNDVNGIGFRRICRLLQNWVEEIQARKDIVPQDEEDCLNSLRNAATRTRIDQVRQPQDKTFQWLFDPDIMSSSDTNIMPFTEWLGDRSSEKPIYWIQGKPGSGKSTLMKFAMRDPRLLRCLGQEDNAVWTIGAFFFHDRGSEIQKSLSGMFQQILASIVEQVPTLIPFIIDTYRDLVKLQRTRKPLWSPESLQSALLSILGQRKISIRILLFLDALDEHHGDNEVLGSLLKKLACSVDNRFARLKICLASRPWPVFNHHFCKCPGFAIHDFTRQDIYTYVGAKLNLFSEMQDAHSVPTAYRRIADLLTTKALGVFIWVRLVTDLIAKGIQDGTPPSTVENQARQMPEELKDLYAHTLRRVEPEYSSEAYIMLQMTLRSLVPIPIRTFMRSLDVIQQRVLVTDAEAPSLLVAVLSDDDLPLSLLQSRLASRGGGLLETSLSTRDPTAKENDRTDPVVQFVHQTAKEYVEKSQRNIGLIDISPEVLRRSGNQFLLWACIALHQWSSCIKKDVFRYARRAIDIDGVGKDRVVADVKTALTPKDTVDELEWFLSEQTPALQNFLNNYNQKMTHTPFFAVAVIMGFPEAVKDERDPEVLQLAAADLPAYFGLEGIDGGKSIDYILSCSNRPLDLGAPWNIQDLPTLLQVDSGNDFSALMVVLVVSHLSDETRVTYARMMLDAEQGQRTRSPEDTLHFLELIELCVRLHSVAMVRLMLQHIAGGHLILMKELGKLLKLAAFRGDKAIVQVLVDYAFDNGGDLRELSEHSAVGQLFEISSPALIMPIVSLSKER